MSKRVKGIIVTRLIVLLTIILVPVSIFLIFFLVEFNLWYSPIDPILNFWIIKILTPTVFSVSWLFFLVLFANRFANTLDSFDEKISVVPSRLKFFYGINAIYILFIFVFPIITPFISVLSFASFAWRLTTFRKESWEDDSKISFLTKFVIVLAAIIPIFCTVSIIPEFLELPLFLWGVFFGVIDYLFSISYSLFTALSIGSLIILFSNSGISEYEQIFVDSTQKKSFAYVKVLELLLFGFFLFLDLSKNPIIGLIYTAGLIIVIFTYFVNMIRGKSKYGSFKSYFVGYFIAAVFIGSNVILTNLDLSKFLKTSSLLISAILYIFILFYTFITIED